MENDVVTWWRVRLVTHGHAFARDVQTPETNRDRTLDTVPPAVQRAVLAAWRRSGSDAEREAQACIM